MLLTIDERNRRERLYRYLDITNKTIRNIIASDLEKSRMENIIRRLQDKATIYTVQIAALEAKAKQSYK